MFGTFHHPTPLGLLLYALSLVAQWRIAPPVTWSRPRRSAVAAGSVVEPSASESY
jgi:hypothetical protein